MCLSHTRYNELFCGKLRQLAWMPEVVSTPVPFVLPPRYYATFYEAIIIPFSPQIKMMFLPIPQIRADLILNKKGRLGQSYPRFLPVEKVIHISTALLILLLLFLSTYF